MPTINNHADSLRRYLTGATSDGGVQASNDLSLGGYASSSQISGMNSSITSPITGISVLYASSENGVGNGSISSIGGNSLAWTEPGGTQGASVGISNGTSVVLEGSSSGKFVIVSSSVDSVSGTATVSLTHPVDNVISMNDSLPSETIAGSVRYRAIIAKNTSAVSINNVFAFIPEIGTSVVSSSGQLASSGAGTISLLSGSFDSSGWPQSGFCRIQLADGSLREIVYYSSRTSNSLSIPSTGRGLLGSTSSAGSATDTLHCVPGLRIAKEVPVSNAIQTIANDTTQPTGRTWTTGITAGTGISVGTLATGEKVGIWIERTIAVNSSPAPSNQYGIKYQFDAA